MKNLISKINNKISSIIFFKYTKIVMILFIFVSLLSYVYFANRAVHILSVLEKTKVLMQDTSIVVSELESDKFVIDNTLDSKLALKMGFIQVENPQFIVKNGQNKILSLKTN